MPPHLRFKTVTEWHRRVRSTTIVRCDSELHRRTLVIDSSSRHVYTTVTPTTRRCLAPDIESDLIHTEGTRTSRPCGVLSGIEIDRFEPLIPCISEVVQDPQHIVNDRSGTNTRAWVRDEDYIKKCGFTRWTRMETLKFTFLREKVA
jgi:hypothetical protein